jgi:G2/mitotic-specific cyclin-B, other
MAHQTDINEKMRAILLDWLEEVHVKFKLMPETLYLTANLIDRFLEKKIVIRSKLQLVGVTAMLIASKYEEIYAPEVRDFVYITDKAYTREQILAMEATMLNTLDFKVSVPTVLVFLNRYLKIAGAGNDEKLTRYATFLVERQVQEYRMLQHAPSKIAASAVNMALRTLRPTVRGVSVWNPTLEFHTGYTERDLRPTILDMQEVMAASVTSSLQAVRKKYSNPKFGEVAGIPLALLE